MYYGIEVCIILFRGQFQCKPPTRGLNYKDWRSVVCTLEIAKSVRRTFHLKLKSSIIGIESSKSEGLWAIAVFLWMYWGSFTLILCLFLSQIVNVFFCSMVFHLGTWISCLLNMFRFWWQDSNRRHLVSEVTALPTEPQPLPIFCVRSLASVFYQMSSFSVFVCVVLASPFRFLSPFT